jgi:hypothetical protein
MKKGKKRGAKPKKNTKNRKDISLVQHEKLATNW